jgi:AAA15 family ATPase/GTPase
MSKPPFIKSIQINNVRHLQNILIPIDDNRCRHLILTGPNGCGKTSVLRALKDYLEGVPSRQLVQVLDWKENIAIDETQINLSKLKLLGVITDEEKASLHGIISNLEERICYWKSLINNFNIVKPELSDLVELIDSYNNGNFLISFFEARRFSQIQTVSGAQKLELPKINPIMVSQQSVGSRFLQFLVNQENRAALLLKKGDKAGVEEIQIWMDKITDKFRELFENSQLTLEYDIDNFDFTINIPGREPFRLVDNQLSDGFSSVLQIVSELLLRMEVISPGHYNMPGIVLIDEVETHLHIRLQKTILPFLTDFFPNIQFIVTTHSPFVLTSLNDAVVFDLESQERWEHMAPMSASAVVEDYFDLDLYSNEIKHKIDRYKQLVIMTSHTANENEELNQIRADLDNVDFESAPELVAEYNYLRAKESVR